MKQLKQQPIFHAGIGVSFNTVRRITEWDGRTVGVVRNGRGAEFVVVQRADHWDVLSGVSLQQVYGSSEPTRLRRR